MSLGYKILEVKCPKCHDLLRIRVDGSTLAEAKSLPVSISCIHGDPVHPTTIWVDSNFSIRAVESPDNTILDRGINIGEGQRRPVRQERAMEIVAPSEAALTDEVLDKLEKALVTIGRMNAEIVLELTRAHDEVTKLSEMRKRKERAAAEAARKKAVVQKPMVPKKAMRPEETKRRTEKTTLQENEEWE